MSTRQTIKDRIKETFSEIGQEQIFRFWNDLNQSKQAGPVESTKTNFAR